MKYMIRLVFIVLIALCLQPQASRAGSDTSLFAGMPKDGVEVRWDRCVGRDSCRRSLSLYARDAHALVCAWCDYLTFGYEVYGLAEWAEFNAGGNVP